MDKNMSMTVALVFVAVVIATVTSFGANNPGLGGGIGRGDLLDRKYQTWLDKRGLGESGFGGSVGFGRPAFSPRYFDWRDFSTAAAAAQGMSKRQRLGAGSGARGFGNFQRFLGSGLQDWKSSFAGIKKRAAPAVQPQRAASAAEEGED